MYIEGALDVPRGILEVACDYGYEETAIKDGHCSGIIILATAIFTCLNIVSIVISEEHIALI